MPSSCEFVVKLTGKYTISSLFSVMNAMSNNTIVAIQSLGKSYGGWSCELCGMQRSLFVSMIDLMQRSNMNMETALSSVSNFVRFYDPKRQTMFPRMNISHKVRRGDHRMMTFL